jgi:hypothetical protein
MTIMHNSAAGGTYQQALAARNDAARALYYAEVALHDAHQTHVGHWIEAAQDRLHVAVAGYSAAAALVEKLRDPALAA